MKRLLSIAGLLAVAAPGFAADSPKQVTFSKDVAPIFQAKCQECHQPNSIAPMSLITYQEARPWARSIKERVATRQMPPWHIDQSVGVQKFKNDMSLSDEQIDTIVRWVDGGAPQGDPKDMPPPKPLVTDNEWKARARRLRPARLVGQVAGVHDAGRSTRTSWWRPMSRHPARPSRAGSRWSRSGRPTCKARKIIHHSIAYLVLNNDPDAVNQGTANGRDRRRRRRRSGQPPSAADGVGDRQGLRPVSVRAPASCSCPARRSPGISTFTPSARKSPAAPKSASGSTRRARSRRSAAT